MEDDDDEIAKAMGFSSFGGTKKRKYEETASPKTKPDASGANSTRLGVRTKAVEDTPGKGKNVPEGNEDTILESTEAAQPFPSHAKGKAKQRAATGLAGFLAHGQTLPDKPNTHEVDMVSFGGPAIPRAELNALRHGVKGEDGEIAYFLPSFVEDPWERLTRTKS